MRRAIALVTAAAFLVANVSQQAAAEGGGQHHAHPPQVEKALSDLYDRIDGAQDLSEEDRARFRDLMGQVENESDKIAAAKERVLVLATSGATAEQRSEVEAEVRRELAQIGTSHAKLASVQRKLYGELQASPELTAAAKAEIESTLQKLEDGSLSLEDAIQSLKTKVELADTEGYGGAFVLILVLFILLVIIGAGFGDPDSSTAN